MKQTKASTGVRAGTIYPYYLFKDHDPVIDEVMTLIEQREVPLLKVAELSGVSLRTLRLWRDRETKKPHHASVAAVVRSLGSIFAIVDDVGSTIQKMKLPKKAKRHEPV